MRLMNANLQRLSEYSGKFIIWLDNESDRKLLGQLCGEIQDYTFSLELKKYFKQRQEGVTFYY